MASYDNTSIQLDHSVKIDTIGALLPVKRLNRELARMQALMAGVSGGAAMSGRGGLYLGGGGGTVAPAGGFKRGIMAQAGAISVLSDKLRGLNTAAKIGGLALGGFAIYAGRQFAKFETQEFSLGLLAGDAKVGKNLADNIKKYAATSPLTTSGVLQAARTLIAHNTAPGNVMTQIKGLGNVATALGIQDLGRFVTPIARAQMMGNLQGQEYNMLVDAGFNVAGLSYKERVASGAIKDTEENRKNFLANFKQYVMDGKLTAEQLNRTLKYAGDVEYAGAAEKAKSTLTVIMSGLFDNLSIAAETLFGQFNKVYDIKGKLQGMGNWLGDIDLKESDIKLIGDTIVYLGGFVIAMKALGIALAGLKWIVGFGAALAALTFNPVVLGLLGLGATGTLIGNAAGALNDAGEEGIVPEVDNLLKAPPIPQRANVYGGSSTNGLGVRFEVFNQFNPGGIGDGTE